MLGQDVCAAHGGRSSQAKHAAYLRHFEARLRRQFAREWARLERETFEWHVQRVVFAAVTLNIPVEEVDASDIWWAYSSTGSMSPPRPAIRRDCRFTTPKPPAYKPRKRAANTAPAPSERRSAA